MSSDQQYPYEQGHGQPYGPGDRQPRGGQPPYRDQQGYDGGQRPHGDWQARGGQQAYRDQQPQGGQQPYRGQQGHGSQRPQGGQQSHGDRQGYGDVAYEPHVAGMSAGAEWPGQQGQSPSASAQADQGDQGATQVWQGQTWDTQYQPTVQRSQGRPSQPQARHGAPTPPEAPGYPQAQPGQQAAALGGGYPQAPGAPSASGAPGAYPLPSDVAAGPDAGHAAPTPGYGAPTTGGNVRLTDAQRARAEGRSPIIAPGIQPAAITAGLGLLLALGAAIGPYALLVPLVLLQAVTAAGWFRLNGMWPARQGIALAFAGGLVADAVLLAAGRENAPAAILGTLGVWVLLTFVLHLRSHAGADERMYGLMASVASASLAVLAAGHLAAVPGAVTAGAVAVAAAVLVRALPLPLPGVVSVVVSLLVAAGAGAAMGAFGDLGAQGSAFLGFAAGGCALIGLRVASYDYPSRFVHMTAGVALPLTMAAPAVYLIGRVIG